MRISRSTVINRPVSSVWQFLAVDHVRNHPRWDQQMELRKVSDGPIGVGTQIFRQHVRTGVPITGTMEVLEFEAERAMATVIHDDTPRGPLEVRSRMTMEPADERSTMLTIELEMPGQDPSMDPAMIERSLARMKELIEAEL